VPAPGERVRDWQFERDAQIICLVEPAREPTKTMERHRNCEVSAPEHLAALLSHESAQLHPQGASPPVLQRVNDVPQ
jgi:hypothetical protein